MSSSVFTESPAKPSDDDNDSSACGESRPNNVVVVYGKNGITVDPAGLERLIDEETISSLSVIRLTSPTPSMKSERDEETEEKIQMATDGIELISNLQFAEENEKSSGGELVGLTVEEFYPPEEAKKIAKEILNYAGLTNSKQIKTYDYEFLRYVIENDHCYTPLRSPNEVNKPSQNSTSATNEQSSQEKITSPLRQYGKGQKTKKAVENVELIEEKPQEKENDDEADEESDYTSTSVSDSDNDRDSDLDFNVNDRGRRRKTSVRRKKIAPKITKKRQSFTDKDNSNLSANSSFEDERKATSSQRSAQRQITEARRNSNASLKTATAAKSIIQRQSHPPQLTAIQKLQASHQSPQKQIQVQQQIVQKPSQVQPQSVQKQPQPQQQPLQKQTTVQQPPVQRQPQLQQQPVQRQPQLQQQPVQKQTQLQQQPVQRQHQLQQQPVQRQPQLQQQNVQRQPQLQLQPMQKPPQPQLQLIEPEPTEQKFHVFEKQTRVIPEQSTSKHQFTNIFQQPAPQGLPSVSHERTNKPRIVVLNGSNFNETRSVSADNLESEQKTISKPDRIKIIATAETKPPLQTVSINRTIQQQQTKGFMPLVADAATKSQLPAQISIQTHSSSSSSSPCPNDLASENDKQLDLIDSIVQDEMKKSSVVVPEPPMNENIPQIVKMLENTEKAILNKQPPKSISLSSSRAFTTRVEDIDITNAPLLDSAEEDIADDLLQQVAELIDENKKVEEALEAHVLMTNARQIEQPEPISRKEPPANANHQTSLPSTSTIIAPHKQIQSAVKKDPIQIVRGDGRVITLPPIEAPTTRAKRRAQTQVAETSTPVSTKNNARKDSTDSRGQTSNSSSRRNSATDQKAANARKRNSTSAQSTPKLEEDIEEEDDDEDEGSSDSEDDPNRLWCICRQPHNNRFMICCDKCEDWFHGTCVNITKAMGLEMESKGVEWTCPKCIKQMDANTKKSVQRKITEIFEKRQAEDAKKAIEIKKPAVLSKKAENQRKLNDSVKKTGENKVQKRLVEVVKPVQAEVVKSPPVRLNISSVALPTPMKVSTSNSLSAQSVQSAHTSTPMTPEVKPQRQEQHAAMSTPVPQQPPPKIDDTPPVSCINCKKIARQNSIYCSDECIRIYAQNAIALTTKGLKTSTSPAQPTTPNEERKKKPFSSFEEALALASETTLQVKNKIERVYVFERKSGKILTGNNAPTTVNLKKWLQDNPTYQVVQPGTPQALAIEKSKQKQKIISNPEPVVKKAQDQQHKIIKLVSEQEKTRQTPSPKLRKYPPCVSIKPGTPQPTTPTYEKAAEQKITHESKQTKHNEDAVKSPTHTKSIKKQISTEQNTQQQQQVKNQQAAAPNQAKEAEPIRLNVKRTLKAQLMSRMNEVDDPKAAKLSEEETEQFANETENEMFKLFNKDTGSKYKAKYRSLMFNIKDRKNQTLFQKICEKIIEPKQLVRMSAEEMASQELAEWRQNENKHQLEMIKKSELDLLSCTKNYVLKTHKGEEVIESKSTDRVSLDITIPVEDVVTVLNNSSVTGIENEEASPELDYAKASSLEFSHDSDSSFKNTNSLSNSKLSNSNMNSSKEERKNSKNKDRDRERERDKDKDRERDKDRQREREKDRERGRERDRDRERDREKRHRSREKHKSKKRSRSRSRERRHSKQLSRDHEKDRKMEETVKDLDTRKKEIVSTTSAAKKEAKDIKDFKLKSQKEQIPAPKDCNLIDKILESTKTVEEAANLIANEKEKATKSVPTSTVMISKSGESQPIIQLDQNENSSNGVDSDQEPSSTVVIPTPPEDVYKKYSSDLLSVIWSGSINMIDVATFQIVVQPIGGNSSDLKKDLPLELDVVGRIGPETVWDYIEKIKKSPNKEIVLLRLVPFCDTENVAYSALYSYLDKRKRLGVVKTISSHIKDFYILPLAAHSPLPPVLQIKENAEFFEDDTRPDLLIGIVIRIMNKRHSVSGQQHTKSRKSESSSIPRAMSDEGRFTPPHSPKRFPSSKKVDVKSIIGAGRLPKTTDPIDINSIIAPQPKIAPAYTAEDADEPYSPGGSSDEDLNTSMIQKEPITVPTNATSDELKRKMDEINRQIEAQKLEIAGMLNLDPQTASKIYSPSNSPTPTLIKPALANISLPPNLHEILSSIKSTEPTVSSVPPPPMIGSISTPIPKEDPDKPRQPSTTPPPPPKISFDDPLDIALPPSPPPLTDVPPSKKTAELTQAKSRLAQLSDAELLSMVRDNDLNSQDGSEDQRDPTSKHACSSPSDENSAKKPRWDDEPPPPGLEDEFV